MSLPVLPKSMYWEARVSVKAVTVTLNTDDKSGHRVVLAERSIECKSPKDWESRIDGLADLIWADMNGAAQLGAKMGLLVIYE